MLVQFLHWWWARLSELAPSALRRRIAGVPDAVVITAEPVAAFVRRRGAETPIALGAAARTRLPVVLRPAAARVLVKTHIVPAAARQDLDAALRHELPRITPFKHDDVYWDWTGRPVPGDRGHTEVRITLVPKVTLAAAFDELATAGIRPGLLEIEAGLRTRFLAMDRSHSPGRGLTWMAGATAGLVAVALILPFALQSLDLWSTERAIAMQRPKVTMAERLRRDAAAGNAGSGIVAAEMAKTGDLLEILARVTAALPDDTYLTDLSVRQRQLAISGRSASAARLITSLSADNAFQGAAFTAPVTRVPGGATDAFSIRAEVAK